MGVTTLNLSLEVQTRDRFPLGWATAILAQANGKAEIGWRTRNLGRLDEAEREVRAARAVLQEGGYVPRAQTADRLLEMIASMRADLARPSPS